MHKFYVHRIYPLKLVMSDKQHLHSKRESLLWLTDINKFKA